MRQVTPTVIVLIKLAALIVAAAPGYIFVYHYGFRGPLWEWGLIAFGILIYVMAKAVLAACVGFVWGRQDARELKQRVTNLHAQVQQDIIDHAPSDVKDRVTDALKDPPNKGLPSEVKAAIVAVAIILIYFLILHYGRSIP